MTLFFLRHGETLFNASGRVTGQQDIPLGPRGRDQAAAAGRTLRTLLAKRGLDPADVAFHVSPLERARVTAELARAAMGLDPTTYTTDPRLMELSLGHWQGLTVADVGKRWPAEFAARSADPWDIAPAGGESYRDLCARVGPALADYARPCVIVAHAGTGRAILHLEGGVEAHPSTKVPIEQGRVLVIESGGYVWR